MHAGGGLGQQRVRVLSGQVGVPDERYGEHPVTELVTGVDLVERQRVCFGNRIAQHLSFQQHQRLGFGKFERYLKSFDR